MGGVVLFVRRVVFFVNDDQAQRRYRQKQGRSGAHHHPGLARPNPSPHAPPVTQGHFAVPDFQRVTEPSAQSVFHLGSQSDFRNQQQRPAAPIESRGDSSSVNLGFAGRGHSLHQHAAMGTRGQGGQNLFQRRCLALGGFKGCGGFPCADGFFGRPLGRFALAQRENRKQRFAGRTGISPAHPMGQGHVPGIQNSLGFHARVNVFKFGRGQPAGFRLMQTSHHTHSASPFAKRRPDALAHVYGPVQVGRNAVIKKTVQGNRKRHFGQLRVQFIYRERPEDFSCLPRHLF
jgi:hypothetical protein